ncbi:hypothetical protein T4D_12176 [Trichinella pseudospiralis]|uniref:Transmembrane protein n=1 Tax=Trichinella pseudospiralis TaxID=6337 RepID=A0A0V1FVY9_TRIPS|nr:hypothetical protein T4D_12176 [Trichinella pseudospiralis]
MCRAVPGKRANNSKCHYFHGMFRRDEVALTKSRSCEITVGLLDELSISSADVWLVYFVCCVSLDAAMHSKAPVYSCEKRAKFARRENKKWVRLATVIGYICAVCLPAVALSVYYVGFWDPHYKEKFPPNSSFALSNLGAASASNSGSEIKTPCNACNIEGTKRKLSPPSRVKQNIRTTKVNNTRDSAVMQSKMSPPKHLVPS